MVKQKNDEKYVCVTPINLSTRGKMTFNESTIIPVEKDLIVVKEQKKVRK